MTAKEQLLALIDEPEKPKAILLLEQLATENAENVCQRLEQEASGTTWGTEVKQFGRYMRRLLERDKYAIARQIAKVANPDFDSLPL